MAHERPHNDDAERREQRKEQPPSAREHAEGDAAVADVCEMDNAGISARCCAAEALSGMFRTTHALSA